jgi:hypothetical protein
MNDAGRFLLVIVLASLVATFFFVTSAQSAHRGKRFSAPVILTKFTDRIYQPDVCGQRCRENARCMSWGYEGPPPAAPIGSTSACYLYSNLGVPFVPDRRYTSALAEEPVAGELDNQCTRMLPVGFPLYLPERIAIPNPGLCAARCRSLTTCRAWTYQKAVTGPSPMPMSCYLTGEDPPTFVRGTGCLSGLR